MELLKQRFLDNMHRHPHLEWTDIETKLNNTIVNKISYMEESGGEPDIMEYEGHLMVVDFSKESPKLRTNTCYDEAARLKRKKFPPEHSAIGLCDLWGIEMIDESLYRAMQALEPLDLKTSSWLKTPDEIRKLGGSLFGDCRYDHVFVYHNGADSYYGARGFRGFVRL